MIRATVLTVGNHAGEGLPINKAKGEKMVLEPPVNSAQRRKLGDITNLRNQENLRNQRTKQQQLVSSKENAENLQKENMRLLKVVMERDGIKSELQKLKIDFHKVKEQNLLLAQANTRILTEFNTSKDQLKVLQHELGCKNGLVMARKILLEEQTLPFTRQASKVKARANACGRACKTSQPNGADHENSKIKQQSSMKSSESSNVNSLQINEKANNKRSVSGRRNPANPEVLDVIGRPGETCQTEDNNESKKLVSDGDNAADKKEFDIENHINDNVQSKRYCAGRQSASFETRETIQTENLQKVVDARKIKEDARFPLKRRSARLKSQKPEPSESFHESKETTRRRSTMFNIQELGGVYNLNGLYDDQEIAAKAGCSANEQPIRSKHEAGEQHDTKEITGKSRVSLRRQSARFDVQELDVTENLKGLHDDQVITANAGCGQYIGSEPEAVKPHETKETTGKSRSSSRRQFAKVKTQRAIKESADSPLHDEESSKIASVSMELKRESENKETGDKSEEMRKTSVGRPLRQAAGKNQIVQGNLT